MRCKQCDYPLWRLKTRTCPECGAGFKPSDFEFAPNSVRFRCVQCEQEYYGVDEHGLLVPRSFECVRCKQWVSMDDMILEPAQGFSDEIRSACNPWLDKSKGRFKRWIHTVGMTLGRPGLLARVTPPDRGGAALWFALRSNITYTLVGLTPLLFFPVLFGFTAGARGGAGGVAGGIVSGLAISLVSFIVSFVVGLGLWTLATHVILRMTGPIAGDISRTGSFICYAAGANILTGIPCVGFYFIAISWIWPAISAGFMLREAHRVPAWRAFTAAIAPPASVALLIGGLFTWLVIWSANQAGAMSGWASLSAAQTMQTVMAVSGAKTYFAPTHAGTYVLNGTLASEELVPFSGMELALKPLVDGYTISSLESTDADRQARALAAFEGAIPADAVAYRLGDFVFIAPPPEATAITGLWSCIVIPEGGFTDTKAYVAVLDGLGSPSTFDQTNFSAMLAMQNRLRAARRLPPIPDPAAIPHDQRNWTAPTPDPLGEGTDH